MARDRASGHTIGVPRGLWQAIFFIRTTYPDRICYCPGVMIASAVCFSLRESGQGSAPCVLLENPDGVAPPTFHPDVLHPEFCSADIPPGCLTSGILLRRHSTRMSHIRHLLRIFYIRHLLRISHIRRLTPDGRGGHFNFPGQTYPDPLIVLIRRVSQPFCIVPRCSPEASRYLRPIF